MKVDVRINCELCNNFKMHYHMHLADALAKDFFMHSLGIKPMIHCLHYMKPIYAVLIELNRNAVA